MNMKYKIRFEKLRDVIRDPSITPLQKCVLLDLLLYAGTSGDAFPSEETLGANAGRSARQVRNCIKELKRRGLINWGRLRYGGPNSYYFNTELYFLNEEE